MQNINTEILLSKFLNNNKRKVAIIDFDVHHGNGSEEIIRNLECNVKETMNMTLPFSGISVNIEKPNCHPWLDFDDAKDVLFISLHGYNLSNPGDFYPSSGDSLNNTSKDSEIYPGGILNIPIFKNKKYSHGYRNRKVILIIKEFRLKVIPRLKKFKPDLIFISAGFDGHENEDINSGYMKLVYYII